MAYTRVSAFHPRSIFWKPEQILSPTQSEATAALRRCLPYALLALANLLWSGNWVIGRALGDSFAPLSLNLWRWTLAALILAPFALPALAGKARVIGERAGTLLSLAFTGVVVFQVLVYLGLRTTTAVNAVLLNSSMPLFMILCSWVMERERATPRQFIGMLVSLAGILVILGRGNPQSLLHLEFHSGDAWILLAMPFWGIYSVLLKRRPPELSGIALLFVVVVMGAAMLVPLALVEAIFLPPHMPTAAEAAAIVYISLFASVLGFICWNRGVAAVGPNIAGFFLHLLPAFGTLLAIAFLGESFHLFQAAGVATILVGVVLATSGRKLA